MSMHRDFTDLEHGQGPQPFDAVVHFAAVPRILIKPDNETFRINTMGTYNVIEAAVKSGIRKIIVASSETTYGVCFAEGHRDFHQFPLDEDYDVNPMDSYGLSKVVNEKTARAFAERSGADIYALRIGNVIEPHEYENFPAYFANPKSASALPGAISMPAIWARSSSSASRRMGWASRSSMRPTTPCRPTRRQRELAARYFPNVPFTREIGAYEGCFPTGRSVRCLVSRKTMTGANMWRCKPRISMREKRARMRNSFFFRAKALVNSGKLNNNPLTSCGALLLARAPVM